MLLSRNDADLFFRLHRSLMHFVNQRLGVVTAVAGPDEFAALPSEDRLEVRKAFLVGVDFIESFVDENPANLSEDELNIALSWRHQVSGTFYAFRQLKNNMVFRRSNAGDARGTTGMAVLALVVATSFQLVGPNRPLWW